MVISMRVHVWYQKWKERKKKLEKKGTNIVVSNTQQKPTSHQNQWETIWMLAKNSLSLRKENIIFFAHISCCCCCSSASRFEENVFKFNERTTLVLGYDNDNATMMMMMMMTTTTTNKKPTKSTVFTREFLVFNMPENAKRVFVQKTIYFA